MLFEVYPHLLCCKGLLRDESRYLEQKELRASSEGASGCQGICCIFMQCVCAGESWWLNGWAGAVRVPGVCLALEV